MASKTVNQAAKLASQAKLFNGIPTTPHYDYEFPFERSFKHQDARAWMTEHWSDSFYWSIGYVLVIFTIKVSAIEFVRAETNSENELKELTRRANSNFFFQPSICSSSCGIGSR